MFFYSNFSTKTLANCNKASIKKSSAHHRNCSPLNRPTPDFCTAIWPFRKLHSNLDFVNICNCNPAHRIIRKWLRVWSSDEIIWRNTTTPACVLITMTYAMTDGWVIIWQFQGPFTGPLKSSRNMFRGGRQVFQVSQAPSGPTIIRPLVSFRCCFYSYDLASIKLRLDGRST